MPLRDGIHGLYSGGCIWKFVFCFRGKKFPLEARDHIWMTRDGVQKTKRAVFFRQVLRSLLHTSGPRLMVAKSPHAKSCVQKVNLPPPFLVGHSLKTPWFPYSTQRSPGMQWWSHALKSSTDGGLGFWVYSIISMASWSPVNWGHSHRIGFHSNEVITWCVLDSISKSNFSKVRDTS